MGWDWTAPDGTEYFVAIVDVTKRPPYPEVVLMQWVVEFRKEGELAARVPLPDYEFGDDLSDEQIPKLYEEARASGQLP